ncbi:MAG: dipeptidase [Candidatus Marinimicrobia bacterium]|nr:dipeptidase [Candidatus Neomarinimicrobiota bacterium]MCF7828011.1 dipeptidase [Candidatus Neomarinimicrobiota bacterium]MCF7879234.1 dipeptidase [Candidatus Neomarinimicrobiota bacterium]
MDNIISYLREHRADYLEKVKDIVAIPSVSSDPERKSEMIRCADHLKNDMAEAGLENLELKETPGNPIVYGDWLHAEGAPTILIYGHYDVQPEDPVDLWETPPFEATERDGRLYGRGVIDDKGQLYIHLAALKAWFENEGQLPLNVKAIFEGEEEIGSKHLDDFLNENKEMLQADCVVVSDTGMFAKGVPSITYGLRGLAYFQIDLEGPSGDLHSGSFGGPVDNPANVLVRMLAQLKDDDGRIAIPGFYDKVQELTDEERENFANLPFDADEFRDESVGAPGLAKDKEYSVLEQLWCRPTLDINGLNSGFTGEGAKTVIPSKAMAKVSMRLVPHQDPEKIGDLFESFIKEIAPDTVNVKLTRMHGGYYYLADINEPMFEAARESVKRAFDKETALIREGGSIPFVHSITHILDSPAILLGFGLPDENAHAPNEWMDLENFYLGMESIAYLYEEISKRT